jgi:polar amino acid transport system substrate-binding protein
VTRVIRIVAAVLALAALAGCGAPADSSIGLVDSSSSTTPTTSPASTSTTRPHPDRCDESLRPFDVQPQPGSMPPGVLADIQARGVLRVGVDQTTLGFGWLKRDGKLEGFDISLADQIGLAMFGEPNHVDLLPVTSDERIGAVQSGKVDLVISVMSITCARAEQVAFSAEYFRAGQGVLVAKDSDIESVDDLAGRKVCATTGSTSLVNLASFAPKAVPYPVLFRTDCLVALQQGQVDAISTDDTILRGFMAQDPQATRLLDWRYSVVEQYGIAINDANDDLVRFVNGVLEAVKADGRWAQYLGETEQRLGQLGEPSNTPPVANYVPGS